MRNCMQWERRCCEVSLESILYRLRKEHSPVGYANGGVKSHPSTRLWALAWSWAITGVAAWCIVVTTWWAVAAERRAVAP